jgi:hypothetical protein
MSHSGLDTYLGWRRSDWVMIFGLSVFFTKEYSCDEDKKKWIGGARDTWWGERFIQGFGAETLGRQLGRPSRRWKDNIEINLQETGGGCVDRTGLAEDRDRCRAVVNVVMKLRCSIKCGKLLKKGFFSLEIVS